MKTISFGGLQEREQPGHICKENLETNKLEVITLSQHHLSQDEISVLELGLRFCPTQRGDKFELAKDMMLFAKKNYYSMSSMTPLLLHRFKKQKIWNAGRISLFTTSEL